MKNRSSPPQRPARSFFGMFFSGIHLHKSKEHSMSPSAELPINSLTANERCPMVCFSEALGFPSSTQYSWNPCWRSHLMLTLFWLHNLYSLKLVYQDMLLFLGNFLFTPKLIITFFPLFSFAYYSGYLAIVFLRPSNSLLIFLKPSNSDHLYPFWIFFFFCSQTSLTGFLLTSELVASIVILES